MTCGPGIYDPEAMELLLRLQADGVFLCVANGLRGSEFAVAVRGREAFEDLPRVLRDIALKIEADIASETTADLKLRLLPAALTSEDQWIWAHRKVVFKNSTLWTHFSFGLADRLDADSMLALTQHSRPDGDS